MSTFIFTLAWLGTWSLVFVFAIGALKGVVDAFKNGEYTYGIIMPIVTAFISLLMIYASLIK